MISLIAPILRFIDALSNVLGMQLCVRMDNEKAHVTARCDLSERVFEALRREGVVMPFETVALSALQVKTVNPTG